MLLSHRTNKSVSTQSILPSLLPIAWIIHERTVCGQPYAYDLAIILRESICAYEQITKIPIILREGGVEPVDSLGGGGKFVGVK